jgi:hypothetical protein
MSVRTIYHFTALTGGAVNALDSIDGNRLLDGDRAFVFVNITSTTGTVYAYHLNATSGAADNGTTIIAPDTNPGTKRWIRCTWG